MKVLLDNYTFNKTSKQITFTDYTAIELERILLITNSTDNIIIFNFASPGAGGTVSGNILTLQYDTSLMDNTDRLQIFYEDPAIAASETLLALVKEQIDNDSRLGRQLAQLLKPLGIVSSGTGKLNIEALVTQPTAANLTATVSIAAAQTLATVTNVSTLATLTNQANIGSLNALDLQYNMAQTAWQAGLRKNLTF